MVVAPNGKVLAFHELTPEAQDDVLILKMEGDEVSGWKLGKPRAFLNGPSAERAPMFSPKDGRWVAYQSTESGRDEVYVRPFPGPAAVGRFPQAGARRRHGPGRATSYFSPRRTVESWWSPTLWRMTIPPGEATDMVRDPFRGASTDWTRRSFDLHPDGNRFALARETQTEAKQDKLLFFFNFFDELHRVAPRSP